MMAASRGVGALRRECRESARVRRTAAVARRQLSSKSSGRAGLIRPYAQQRRHKDGAVGRARGHEDGEGHVAARNVGAQCGCPI